MRGARFRPWHPAKLAGATARALALGALQAVVGVLAFAFLVLHALTPA